LRVRFWLSSPAKAYPWITDVPEVHHEMHAGLCRYSLPLFFVVFAQASLLQPPTYAGYSQIFVDDFIETVGLPF
jgi:hypothetical protein